MVRKILEDRGATTFIENREGAYGEDCLYTYHKPLSQAYFDNSPELRSLFQKIDWPTDATQFAEKISFHCLESEYLQPFQEELLAVVSACQEIKEAIKDYDPDFVADADHYALEARLMALADDIIDDGYIPEKRNDLKKEIALAEENSSAPSKLREDLKRVDLLDNFIDLIISAIGTNEIYKIDYPEAVNQFKKIITTLGIEDKEMNTERTQGKTVADKLEKFGHWVQLSKVVAQLFNDPNMLEDEERIDLSLLHKSLKTRAE